MNKKYCSSCVQKKIITSLFLTLYRIKHWRQRNPAPFLSHYLPACLFVCKQHKRIGTTVGCKSFFATGAGVKDWTVIMIFDFAPTFFFFFLRVGWGGGGGGGGDEVSANFVHRRQCDCVLPSVSSWTGLWFWLHLCESCLLVMLREIERQTDRERDRQADKQRQW